ncbi:hypothetical protein H257_14705 [Aphanomyces astaci]|uniref:CCHC-type domain-containing protein n=1 Tax=Aphanomyces astaci TaxID=112090 RepID=W4FSI5_APHAT|nr:hypothetical protein H257_14705 [Aphanomyces astaci]ETV69573.1 hypothetical protein H257_14705 [Aphanomyces astaci]|eukprot:XP_009840900.1 hypothetical protein H257_14705 [Aphanomyces astaci]
MVFTEAEGHGNVASSCEQRIEEEVSVTEPPLVPVVGGTTGVLPTGEKSKSEEVWKTMEELAKANKATGSARAASMTWIESRRRYGGQTMGPNWEQLPRPPIEGANADEDNPPPEKSDAEKRADEKAEARAKLRAERRNRPDSTPDSEEEEKEYQEEQRKQAERRLINKANHPLRQNVSTMPKWRVRPMIDGCWTPPYQAAQDGDLFRADHRRQAAEDGGLTSTPKRETYEDKLRANAQRMGGKWRWSAVGWIPSTDRSFLKATCTYVWRVPVEQRIEDDYRDHIMEIVLQPATKWTPTKSDMQTYCQALSVDPHGDVPSRLVSYSTMLRTFVKVVAARVTPPYLRDRVEEQMKTVPANDLVAFADILREQLDRTHDAYMVNQQWNSYGSKRGREEDDQGRRIMKHAKKANQAVRDQRELRGNYPRPPGGYIKPERSAAVWSPSTQKRTGVPPATKYGPQANSRPRHDDRYAQAVRDEARPRFAPGRDDRGILCFVCQQPGHMARECPNKKDGDSGDTSWKKGKNAVKRFKTRERKANMQAKRMKKPPPPSKEDDGRWVRLNSMLEVPYCPDTGADQNIVPQAMVDELQPLQPQLQVVQLAAPFTASGPVKVAGKRHCYVVNDGDEFLVSDDTIKTIGIDIDRLQVDEDGDNLEEVGGDCVELPQRSAVRAATMKAVLPVATNEVEEALQGMIDGAVDNGFPMEHVKYLWDVLSKHDIWRIKFNGADPPAKVKPLKVTPKDGCVPYRCKGRQHNLLEERFLKLFAQELLNAGVMKSNQRSAWCSPVNSVLKPDGRKSLKSADKWSDGDVFKNYRLTNDYRVVNSLTELKAGIMPFQATILQNLRGKKTMGVSHPRDDATMCLFTNASDYGWSIVVTQVVGFDDDSPVQEQRHELLYVSWGCLRAPSRRDVVKMYYDHKNLIHVFAPGEEWKAHTRGKLMRWAAIIGGYRYEIMHIDGIHNLDEALGSADTKSGDQAGQNTSGPWLVKVKGGKVPPLAQPKLRPLDKDFVWPCMMDIRHAQDQHDKDKPKRTTVVDGLWQVDERLWIPSAANDLIQRIMVVAHYGSAGHRGHAALVATIRRLFYVDRLADRASEFLRGCLLCPHVKGGRVVHRPYASRWHAKERNEGIHFDYLYMGEAFSGANRLDEAVRNATSLGQRPGNPFQNVAMKALAHKFKRNGTVELMNHDILQVTRVMLREYQLAEQELDYLLPVVQTNLPHHWGASRRWSCLRL